MRESAYVCRSGVEMHDPRSGKGWNRVTDKPMAGRMAADLRVVFEVAMRERCMHRSAVRLGLTELDVRSALQQIDATLGEPVFTIDGSSLTPTGCAQLLAHELHEESEPEAK